ncbi:Arm DNA-binding domain-containing protein, partial [Bacillus thuringiensis]|uniref:Arm DNA-binding domain-containing protein n=1 Tax=Bacillus thuringiensis TaxID=1428 RepID=UPI003EB87AAC
MPVYKDKERKTWYFKVRYKDMYGRNKQKLKRGFKKRGDAILAEAEFVASIKDAFTDEVTFDEVFEHNITFKTYKPKTIRRRTNEYNLHIKPRFGHIKVKDINTQQVLDFQKHLSRTLNSPESARTVYSNFKVLMNHAKRFYNLRTCLKSMVYSVQKRMFPMIHDYTSNISREQFELIREDLENARKTTRPRT